jgi:hypothetical protein
VPAPENQSLLYVKPGTDWAVEPLKINVAVDGVIKPELVQLPPTVTIAVSVQVKKFLVVFPGIEIFPLAVKLPVDIVSVLVLPLVLLNIVRLVQISVPAPTLTVCAEDADGFEYTISLVTVKLFVPLITRLFDVPAVNVTDKHVKIPSTVTVAPEAISTASPLAGLTPPDHVPPALQLPPDEVLVIVAAFRFTRRAYSITKTIVTDVFIAG